MKHTIGILAILAAAGVAQASISTTVPFTVHASATFTNKASIDAVGDVDNAHDTWISTYTGPINGVRVTGSLTRNQSGTYVSEARVRFSGGFGNRDVQSSSTNGYTGTVAVGPIDVPFTSLNLNTGDVVGLEWFESAQDGTAGLAESTWNTVTYEFGFGGTTITNGNIALGAITGTTTYSGSHVAGGLDFITFSVPAIVNPGDSLYIGLAAGLTGTSMEDTEIALYDSLGNQVGYNDDIDYPANAFSELTYDDLVPLAGGTYTLVTAGYNSSFPSTLGGTFTPGTDAGTYELAITYVPTPGALALLGMGGLIANRRRR